LTRKALHPDLRFFRSLISQLADFGKSLTQPGQQVMGPHIFRRQNDQSDQYEQDTLQNGQKETGDSQKQESPANYQNQDAFDLPIHSDSLIAKNYRSSKGRLNLG
jgi:hypothetical protein